MAHSAATIMNEHGKYRATAGELWAIQQVRVFETAGSSK
jgi:hypothetical protein